MHLSTLLLICFILTISSVNGEKLSNRFIFRSAADKDEIIQLIESNNFKFIDTINDSQLANDSRLFIFESDLKTIKRSSINPTQDFEILINNSLTQLLQHPNILSGNREKLLDRSKRDMIDQLSYKIPIASRGFVPNRKASRITRVPNKISQDETKFGNYTDQDPMWPKLWYMNRHAFNKNLTDMNIISAWVQGFTGKGVSVTFLDDGLEWDHPDIKDNYDPEASYDFNDNDKDPMPRYDVTNENKHGTRCAGEVAATGNNSICSIGIAYNAGVGGIRMLDGPITDSLEAKSLSLNSQHIDIYSASWGPTDNGEQLDGPDRLAAQALKFGARLGRQGKGSIFTWASGNGGIYGDTCACDGYVNSIYTFAISSTTDQETKPWYLEECTSVLATTYSSGDINVGQHSIATTDLRHRCTTKHTATSAAAPIAAGIIALAVEANKNATWRDFMHMVVLTSRAKILKSNNYFENKAGFLVSSRYGFGLMDAGHMVKLAKTWENVPEIHSCYTNNSTLSEDRNENVNRAKTTIITNACANTTDEVNFIEQVEIIVTIHTDRRGQIELYLTSPMGTRTMILSKRRRDRSGRGFRHWTFMTVQLWGESPKGEWTLEVTNFDGRGYEIEMFALRIHGTETKPRIYETMPNNNHPFIE